MLFFLIAAHALMDYPLQGDATATCKCPSSKSPLQKEVPWYYWLTAHAVLHGAAVGVVVRWWGFSLEAAAWVGVAEAVVHWLIDLGKCQRLFSIHADQAAHVACKVVWWAVLTHTAFATVVSGTLPSP